MLENVPLFAGLSRDELLAVSRVAVKKSYPKHTIVINAGDTTDSVYIINSGKVKVLIGDDTGREIILAMLGQGEFFGEMSLIDDQPRSATVVTMETSEFTIISKGDFNQCLLNNPPITTHILQGLARRLREADKKIESLALLDVYGRVARTLLQLADKDNGNMVVKEKLSQKDIANMIGASREMVSRILKDLVIGGYVKMDGKRITLMKEKLPRCW
ncbi:MAG: Crp/Fnr family transcriptional regulator [Burkholderiales bacterium]